MRAPRRVRARSAGAARRARGWRAGGIGSGGEPRREDGVEDVLSLTHGGGSLWSIALLALGGGDENGVVVPHQAVDGRDHRAPARLESLNGLGLLLECSIHISCRCTKWQTPLFLLSGSQSRTFSKAQRQERWDNPMEHSRGAMPAPPDEDKENTGNVAASPSVQQQVGPMKPRAWLSALVDATPQKSAAPLAQPEHQR